MEHVPAWKRAGLKQKQAKQPTDGLKESIKRTADSQQQQGDAPKKAPKRPKLPKSERKAVEPDQLAYLRKFHEDKANWKFQKAKQIWLAKNLFGIDSKYEDALRSYFKDIKGQIRDKLVDDSKDIIKEYNEFMSKPLDESSDDEDEPEAEAKDDKANDEKAKVDSKADPKKSQEPTKKRGPAPAAKQPKAPPTETQALRAQYLLEQLTGNKPELVL